MDNYFDVYYQQNENPVFCYRSGLAVYEEALYNGALISRGWNAAGYPLNVLTNCPTVLDKKRFAEPFAFNIELDGQSVDFGLEFADFIEEKTNDNIKTCLILKSKIKPVQIKVHTLLDGSQMFSRWLEIENLSDVCLNLSRLSIFSGPLEVMEADRLTLSKAVDDYYSIGYFGKDLWADEGKFEWRKLCETTSVDTRFGRNRFRHPIVFIRNNLLGKIWFAQIGWSGGCRFSVDYNAHPENRQTYVSFKAEITSHNPMLVIRPYEKFVTPEVHIGIVQGGLDDAINEMHSHIRKSVLNMPEADGSAALVNCGMGAEHDMSVETSKAFIRQFAEMGGEIFTVDAGWECPPHKEMQWGDYNGINLPDSERYPNGISEIADYAHEMGLKFGLWVDIESLGKLSPVYNEHPEWRSKNPFGEQVHGLLDLSIPEAAKWAEDELARIISEYKLDLLRVDHNIDYTEYFSMRDTDSGRPECVSIRHFNAVYRMYENLKKRFPKVLFENCAGGGARTDLGMMKNFNHTWVSDWQKAPHSVMITNGMTMALPPERVDRLFAGMGCHEFGSLDFQMRNTMLGHISLNVVAPAATKPNPIQMEFIKHSVDIYKNFIRDFLPVSKIYHHTPETDLTLKNGYSALEISAPDYSKGAIAAFTLTNAKSEKFTVIPKGTDAGKKYKITLDNSGTSFEINGSELISNGICIDIPSSLSSELILYEAIL